MTVEMPLDDTNVYCLFFVFFLATIFTFPITFPLVDSWGRGGRKEGAAISTFFSPSFLNFASRGVVFYFFSLPFLERRFVELGGIAVEVSYFPCIAVWKLGHYVLGFWRTWFCVPVLLRLSLGQQM